MKGSIICPRFVQIEGIYLSSTLEQEQAETEA